MAIVGSIKITNGHQWTVRTMRRTKAMDECAVRKKEIDLRIDLRRSPTVVWRVGSTIRASPCTKRMFSPLRARSRLLRKVPVAKR
jgi:hypothetical protein